MLADATALIGFLFSAALAEPRTLGAILLTCVFIALACLLGYRHRVVSRTALMNTLTTFGIMAINLMLAPLIYFAAEAMRGAYASLGLPSVSPSFWMQTPWLIVALIALVTTDFANYCVHRALHTKIGWPIHAVHHSDTHVNGFTTFRVHALELVMMTGFYIALLTWIGIPAELVVAAHVLSGMHNAYVHLEADIDHGPLNWLIASPRFHRWHHADKPEAYGKNLANIMPLWDKLFGTYYEAGPCHEIMGAERDGIPATDPVKLALLPFALWLTQAREMLGKVGAARAPRMP
ncbi:ERG3 Sterol desaturase [Rhabdaerophilaceae bacterium]